MIPEGTEIGQITEELARGIIGEIERYRSETGRTYASIARAIGYSSATLSQVVKGNYAGNWREVVRDLDAWLDDQRKHDASPKPSSFVWTTVAREIEAVANVAIQLRSIGLVYGPDTSGIGKTMALQAIAAEKPGSVLVTVKKVWSAPSRLFYTIAEAMGLKPSYNTGHLFQQVCKALKGTPRLLMIDQIHSLCDTKDDRAFFQLMDLFDETTSPQLWCGTRDIVAYLNRRIGGGGGKETLAQIRRRICPVRDLMQRTRSGGGGQGEPLCTVDEVRRIFAKNKIKLSSDGIRYLMRLVNTPDSGALGTAVKLVQMATIIYEKQNVQALTAEHLHAAQQFLLGVDLSRSLETAMGMEDIGPVAKAG